MRLIILTIWLNVIFCLNTTLAKGIKGVVSSFDVTRHEFSFNAGLALPTGVFAKDNANGFATNGAGLKLSYAYKVDKDHHVLFGGFVETNFNLLKNDKIAEYFKVEVQQKFIEPVFAQAKSDYWLFTNISSQTGHKTQLTKRIFAQAFFNAGICVVRNPNSTQNAYAGSLAIESRSFASNNVALSLGLSGMLAYQFQDRTSVVLSTNFTHLPYFYGNFSKTSQLANNYIETKNLYYSKFSFINFQIGLVSHF